MTDDVRKLLGGYATGTLTDEEKQVLYEAALQDDQLFEALENEQALKELLDDPAYRAQLLQAAETHRFTVRGAFREWFERPKSKVLVGAGLVALIAITIQTVRHQPQHMQVAQVKEPVQAVPYTAPPPSQASELAPAAPKVRRAAPTPKPKPPAPAETVVTAGETQLKYTVVLDEPARVIVEANQRGFATLTAANTAASSAPLEPGQPATMPIPPAAASVKLSFRRLPSSLVGNAVMSTAMRDAAEREKVQEQRFVEKKAESRPAAAVPESPLTVDIKIVRK
jgi:hypothetical protein